MTELVLQKDKQINKLKERRSKLVKLETKGETLKQITMKFRKLLRHTLKPSSTKLENL